jgi:Cu/Ag efflux protein CusF
MRMPITRLHFYHEAVCAVLFRSALGTKAAFPKSEAEHENSEDHFGECCGHTPHLFGRPGATGAHGSIVKVDEANDKVTIQQTQSGTVGASSGGGAEDFKVQDGLLFKASQPGDKVVFTATEMGGVKTITKLEKQ